MSNLKCRLPGPVFIPSIPSIQAQISCRRNTRSPGRHAAIRRAWKNFLARMEGMKGISACGSDRAIGLSLKGQAVEA